MQEFLLQFRSRIHGAFITDPRLPCKRYKRTLGVVSRELIRNLERYDNIPSTPPLGSYFLSHKNSLVQANLAILVIPNARQSLAPDGTGRRKSECHERFECPDTANATHPSNR